MYRVRIAAILFVLFASSLLSAQDAGQAEQPRSEARKHSAPKVCAFCGGVLQGKKADALYCSDKCRKRFARTGYSAGTAEASKSRTVAQ